MAVKIRLRRMGRRNTPFFRVVVADERSPLTGRFIEELGWYDPKLHGVNYKLDLDRVNYWRFNGAQLSDTVASLVRQAVKAAPPAPIRLEDLQTAPDRSMEEISVAEAPSALEPLE